MPQARKKKKNPRNSKRASSKVVKKKRPALKRTPAPAKKEGSLSVLDQNGKAIETIVLDAIFSADSVHTDVVYQAVLNYQAGEREGTASTLDRGHVRGGGKKPWKQKGTGRARHASRRSPIWRGGGVTFGPSPRDYSYVLPPAIKRRAVAEVVKDKVLKEKLLLVNQISLETVKTKNVVKLMKSLKLEKPLFLVEQKNQPFMLASRNIPGVAIKTAAEVNALDIVSHKECVMTKGAYSGLLKRLKS